MKKSRSSEITKEQLLEFGMKEAKSDAAMIFPMEKLLSKQKSEDGGRFALCVTRLRNITELCLVMPDTSIIYLNVRTIEELKAFEKCIGSWESAY